MKTGAHVLELVDGSVDLARNASAIVLVPGSMELAHVPDRMFAKIALTAVVVVAGGRLVACTPHRAPAYYLADELIARGLYAHEGEEVRVHGYVAIGSIDRSYGRSYGDDALHHFLLVWQGVGLRVQVRGALPDTFRDQSEVIVTGRLVHRDGWTLEGTAVIAKCSANYNAVPATPVAAKFQ